MESGEFLKGERLEEGLRKVFGDEGSGDGGDGEVEGREERERIRRRIGWWKRKVESLEGMKGILLEEVEGSGDGGSGESSKGVELQQLRVLDESPPELMKEHQ